MSHLEVRPSRIHGHVAAPPSKSVTHRALLLAAQSRTSCTVSNALLADDTKATLACLAALGAQPRLDAAHATIRFEPAPLRPTTRALDCRNSGTTLRLLAATAARLPAPTTLTGDASLRNRPNEPLLAALSGLGATCRSNGGRAPITVQGPLRPGHAELPSNTSSQHASALLLSLPFLPAPSTVALRAPIASAPYIDVTLSVARHFGLRVAEEGAESPAASHSVPQQSKAPTGLASARESGNRPRVLHIPGGQTPNAPHFRVEGDWSSAAFLLGAAAATQGNVTVTGLDAKSPQGDRAIVDHLAAFGARAAFNAEGATVAADGPLHGAGHIDLSATPDLFPILAAVAAASRGTTTFTGGSQLRAKETDRIAAMAAGLQALGAATEVLGDGLRVTRAPLHGTQLASLGDHRIHMALAVAALCAQGPSRIDDAASVAVSYPAFHADLARLGADIRLDALEPATTAEATP